MDEIFEWSIYQVTDNRANDIMIWKSGRFVNGQEIEERPEIIYTIDLETLYKLIEKLLVAGDMEKIHITKNIFEVTNA